MYIDKSIPIDPDDHTLDNHLNLDICLLNPDSKRVVDTAEFVLQSPGDHSCGASGQLQTGLDSLRKSLPGTSTQASKSAWRARWR